MKRVFIINGSGGAGKDTFVRLVGKKVPVMNVSSVDKVKEAAQILGWDGKTKDEATRYLLAEMKKLSVQYDNGPVNYMRNRYREFMESDKEVLFLHIREPEEIKIVQQELHAKTILVRNGRAPKITSNTADANVENYDYDIEINNGKDINYLRYSIVPSFLMEQKLITVPEPAF